MNAAHDELLRRREQLQSRSAMLRHDWAQQVQVLRAPLRVADRARAATHWLAQHPEWPMSAALILVLLRPARALQGYSLYRRVQRGLPHPKRAGH